MKAATAQPSSIDEPLPLDLVTRIVKFRVGENHAKASGKRTTKSTAKKRALRD